MRATEPHSLGSGPVVDSPLPSEFLEGRIEDRILAPVLEIEVPPFFFVNGKAFGVHGSAEQVAMPALPRRAAGIIGKRAIRELVVAADHFDRLAALQVV